MNDMTSLAAAAGGAEPEMQTVLNNPNWSFADVRQFMRARGRPARFSSFTRVSFLNSVRLIFEKKEGFTLNACCGFDPSGDVKMDISLDLLRRLKAGRLEDGSEYVCGDVRSCPFRPLSFDTVVCDPPFSLYNRFTWILWLSNVARKKLILSVPSINIRIRGFRRTLYAIEGYTLFLRLWYVFARRMKKKKK